jgi:hypothetical protein
MGERTIRVAVVVVNLFAALSAFAGALGLVVGYMDVPVSELQGTPFADFTVPALLLGFVVGGSALAAALIAILGPHRIALFEPLRLDALMSAIAGCIMVGWMTIEIAMIGLDTWVQALYLVVGALLIGLAALLQWAESHETGVSAVHHPA